MSTAWREAFDQMVVTESLPQTVVLSGSEPRSERHVALRLSGLPALWPATGAVVSANLQVKLDWSYAVQGEQTAPSQAVTEYPPIEFRFGQQLKAPTASSLPLAMDLFASFSVFEDCVDGKLHCCEYGSTECHTDAVVSVARLDTGNFSDIKLSWQFFASAMTDDCPLENSSPELTLEELSP